ncbi:MAG TPA: ABC transporter ATP-binding protein, partial [Holophaga sp.]|nr:ABC transporter ATP-binding protein [Holophaga sp.]
MDRLLEVKDLKVEFRSKHETVKAVDGVSFDVYEGETFGLVGESGCGKSQTCRAILSLLKKPGRVVGGEIRYKGMDLVGMAPRQLRRIRGREISVVFQEPMTSLNPVLSIKRQLYEVFAGAKAPEKWRRATELLRLVGIPSPETRMREYTHQFSGGMRQRAMIAIALGSDPRLLIADEPTTALDVTIQDQVLCLLEKLKQDLSMSIILVTHDLGVIARLCDRVAVMYAGIVVEMADTVTLFSKPRHPYTYALMGALPDQRKVGLELEAISGAPPNLADPPPGCPFAPRCRFAERACQEARPVMAELEPGHFT